MSDRLARLLGGDELTWLVDRARTRLERGRPLTGSVSLAGATHGQRRAVETLLGRRAGSGASLSVSLEEVDRVLRASGACDGLAEAVALLRGPIRDLAALAADRDTAWRTAFAGLDAHLDGRVADGQVLDGRVADRKVLAGWRGWLDSSGLVRRLAPEPADAGSLLDRLVAVLERLPSTGVPIGRLAAETCGDAHALDDGRPVATLALSAARALAGLPYAADGGTDARRAAWAAVGVHLDELSSLVLSLGLPGDPIPGEPHVRTLRQLRRAEPIAAGLVRLCENPVVVAAAADDLGAACPPLVCVNGRPSAAVWRLLGLLAAGGSSFAYHGDFDWGGVAIAAAVHERVGFTPWRYDAASYRRAAGAAPLAGRVTPTPWDPPLSEEMRRRAVRVEEELVLAELLSDLAAPQAKTSCW
ncbi:TIGR02679 family protein [Nonomuraea sp. NPDC050394]|uniref:TIGR02679 family protein n=1 Tax=Nonomuraea sp. NPDC050394 TaxID=3364363 RepID=UPI00379D47B0